MALVVAGVSVVQPYVLARSATAVSCPADTTEDVLATIPVPAGVLGINGWLRISALWTLTSSANNKTLRARFSGTSGTAALSTIVTTATGVRTSTVIANRGSASSQSLDSTSLLTAAGSAPLVSETTSSVDTAAATSVSLSGQKVSSGETLTLESYLVELFPTV